MDNKARTLKKVSIIVPVYNVESSISRCLKSIQTQTFKDLRIILIDDGSTDNSGMICDRFAEDDSRITVIHQENMGVSAARNAGIKIAKSEYFLFVDSDDYLDSEFVEMMLHNESDLTLCGMQKEDENGRKLSEVKYSNIYFKKQIDIDYVYFISQRGIYSPYCKLFRSSIIKDNEIRFPKDISWGEDGMFLGDYLQYADSIRFIDYNGYHYVRYSGATSLSTRVRRNIMDMVVTSRLYLRDALIKVSKTSQNQINDIIDSDICLNCKIFLETLLTSHALTNTKKIELLDIFINNQYVIKLLDKPEKYFSKQLQKCFRKRTTSKIVEEYDKILIRQEKKRIWKKRILRRLNLLEE